MAWALIGGDASQARWHVWEQRGSTTVLRWLGQVQFLAWWGKWHHQATAAYYGDALESLVVAQRVELP